LAEQAGDSTGAGRAAITLIEELGERMSARDICANFERAADLLNGSKHLGDLARLSACAGLAVRTLAREREQAAAREAALEREARAGETAAEKWDGFSLKHEVRRYEAELIERALHEADGVVSRAAQLLGFKHHQTFIALLNNRHKNLLHARNPIVPRKRQTTRARAPRRTTR
jgi:transcriptional regulator with GAF, ATPase, and Fis domain